MNARKWLRSRREAKAKPAGFVAASAPVTSEAAQRLAERFALIDEALRASTISVSELSAARESALSCTCAVIYSTCYPSNHRTKAADFHGDLR